MAFVNRQEELRLLDEMAQEPGAQLVMVYGRRRVGKTTLLLHWAEQTGLPLFYWVAKRDPREILMANMARAIYSWQHDSDVAINIQVQDWEQLFQMLAQAVGDRRVIVILDELPYALQQDRGLGSHLQAAWDHLFKDSQVLLFLSGSHIGMLTDLTQYQAPLYGRLTAQFPLFPLKFSDVVAFLPQYDVYQRLAVYAMLGGIPAYLERWRDRQTIKANVEHLFLKRTGWFQNEALVLISDLSERETTNYESILKAIAAGYHTREDIAANAAIQSTALSHYLPPLEALHMIERRIPATVPLEQLKTSRRSRYFLRDPFLRFYYRFIDPNLHLIEGGLPNRLWQMIDDNFRAFVALEFEDRCREWVVWQAQHNNLPFAPDNVGSHWSKEVQIDVVAINWQEKQLLVGECKWGDSPLSRQVVTDLVSTKTPKLLHHLEGNAESWQVHYAFFTRHSFTDAAQHEASNHGAILRTLSQIDSELSQ
ncbi:MAG: ATP-binding protein [Chloroflexi bacterium]|nr:ATP-binding protein [Ardenticatenaceae bacterium]MBL1127056.1 ATP-binding protein [Chloroflexota bacterium]NOG33117.1 ATP-binding protein [Chloroflexota bacterium]GIK54584.1 MAG: ArsR family transcriptional regulator [Chloroflexota bacterium]